MGYILPVINYQYSQYAEREIGLDYDPYMIQGMNRIRKEAPLLKGQDQQEQTAALFQKEQQPVLDIKPGAFDIRTNGKEPISKKKVHPFVVNKAYAEITGKGRYYSETI